MDLDAVRAALSAPVLAGPISRSLGLSAQAVEAALVLLAEGAQPAFVALHRPDRAGGLTARELERVQAAAVRAAAFAFQRESLRQELRERDALHPQLDEILRAATHPLELDDVRVLLRKRKRGPAAKARGLGLAPLADVLLQHGTTGPLSDPSLAELRRTRRVGDDASEAPAAPGTGKRKRRRRRRGNKAAAEGAAAGEGTAGSEHGEHEHGEHEHEHGEHEHGEHGEHEHEHGEHGEHEHGEHEHGEHEHDEHGHDEHGHDEHEHGHEHGEHGEHEHAAAAHEQAHDAAPAEAEPEDEAPEEAPSEAVLQDPFAWAASRVGESMPTLDDVLAHTRTIVAERIAEWPTLRTRLRAALRELGRLSVRAVPERREKAARWSKYLDKSEVCANVGGHTLLSLHRGEREGALVVEVDLDEDAAMAIGREVLGIREGDPAGEQIALALAEAWQHSLGKAVRAGARRMMKEHADREAIAAYADALRPMLLAPALGAVPVLGLDPGFAPGCRAAVVDGAGTVLEHDTLYPLQPKQQLPQTKARLAELIAAHHVAAIAIADAGGGRELERIVRDTVRELPGHEAMPIVLVDSDVVALLAASRSSKDELREESPLRRAVEVARRVQDPLLELIKVDPRKLGLGQFQHEVDQEELRGALEQATSSCVCELGVDVNTANAELLARVPGLSHASARALVAFRDAKGGLRTRSQLFEVPGIAGKSFEQGAAFLRIHGGEQPLDATAIHPERYPLVTQIARDLGMTVPELLADPSALDRLGDEGMQRYLGSPSVSGEPLGPVALAVLQAELRAPGRDPRPPFESVAFDPKLRSFADLAVGMELEGVITRIANFGAFVDVGLPHEGLVHISELSHGFTASPGDVVHIGQVVKGRVIEIDAERKRFSLSLRALLPKPERLARPERGGRRDGERTGDRDRGTDRGGERRGGGGKPDRRRDDERAAEGGRGQGRRDDRRDDRRDRGGPKRGGRRQDEAEPKNRTLNFHLDLSALVDRVGKG
ncbi:MAG: S1 RNA-binding domain-containing protein [Nannocystaceae bacterium]|nr:S1 RNA-binding domain-containing protein [Nannocystaceae bacterium]